MICFNIQTPALKYSEEPDSVVGSIRLFAVPQNRRRFRDSGFRDDRSAKKAGTMQHAIVIDDSRAMRMILKRTVSELGFECLEAGDGQEAINVLKGKPIPQLALLDWNMPVMNGYEFLKEIRKDPAYEPMRIMMVTTENEMDQVVRALTAGADEYVMKPFTNDVIREKLHLLGFEAVSV